MASNFPPTVAGPVFKPAIAVQLGAVRCQNYGGHASMTQDRAARVMLTQGSCYNVKIMAKSKRIALLAARWCVALVLSACVPEFVHPLSDPALATVDARLTGLWSAHIDDEDAFLHFIPRSDGWMEIVMVSYRNNREAGAWSVFRMFPSHLDGRDYMNVRFVAEAVEIATSKHFVLTRYHLSQDDALTIWSMTEQSAHAAIRAGLKGSVREGRFGNDILIEGKGPELAAFLHSRDVEKLFDNKAGPFRRIQF